MSAPGDTARSQHTTAVRRGCGARQVVEQLSHLTGGLVVFPLSAVVDPLDALLRELVFPVRDVPGGFHVVLGATRPAEYLLVDPLGQRLSQVCCLASGLLSPYNFETQPDQHPERHEYENERRRREEAKRLRDCHQYWIENRDYRHRHNKTGESTQTVVHSTGCLRCSLV